MTALPDWLEPFFWDHDFASLALPRDERFVIERLMTRGTWRAQKWLRAAVGDQALRTWLFERRGRPLTARQLAFWQLILELPEATVAEWLQEKARSLWFSRTTREASS